jgi:hypothetical protein
LVAISENEANGLLQSKDIRVAFDSQRGRGYTLLRFAETLMLKRHTRSLKCSLATMLAIFGVAVFGATGCTDDIVRDVIEVPEPDAFTFPDKRIESDGDLGVPQFVSVLNVRPTHGPFTGGGRVIVSGSGFDETMEVRFNGKLADPNTMVLLSPVAVEVVVPAGKVGPSDVEVKVGDNTAKLAPGAYNYDPLYLDPNSGPTTGGTLFTMTIRDVDVDTTQPITLAGNAVTELEVLSNTTLRARTPAGLQGPAKLELTTKQGNKVSVDDAFTYYLSTNQRSGGVGGGPINGTVTVSVLNELTRAPIANARVVLQKGRTTLTLDTNSAGIVVFKKSDLKGPVTVTAGAPRHETNTIALFDARDATLFLMPIIPPSPGGLPPGQLVPSVSGHVLFGGTTGAGLAEWKIVPEPKKDEVKRVYVLTTNPTIRRHNPPTAGVLATLDFDRSEGVTAWPYQMYTRTGNFAIYAVAGLYHRPSNSFAPYGLGIVRGIVTAPGDRLEKVDIVVNIPLTEKLDVLLDKVPTGVDKHQVRMAVNLGADGYILFDENQREGEGVPTRFTFGRLPKLTNPALVDALYAVDITLESRSPAQLPLTRATETSIKPTERIIIGDFVAPPRQEKPLLSAVLQGNTLRWSTTGGAASDLAITVIEGMDQTPIWRIVSRGDVNELKLPDPETLGLPAWPSGPLLWLQYQVKLDQYDFDNFTYSHTSSSYWKRWSFDNFFFQVASQ